MFHRGAIAHELDIREGRTDTRSSYSEFQRNAKDKLDQWEKNGERLLLTIVPTLEKELTVLLAHAEQEVNDAVEVAIKRAHRRKFEGSEKVSSPSLSDPRGLTTVHSFRSIHTKMLWIYS